MNVTQKLISTHLIDGKMIPGEEVAIKMDQTLTQDATGTLVMLELEAMELYYRKTEASTQYVDHNLIQEDYKNPDDHLFLQSAAERFGLHFSRSGNGVSHPVHMQNFGRPGITLVGSDSHTPAAGALGMLALMANYYHEKFELNANGQAQNYAYFLNFHDKVYQTEIQYKVSYDESTFVENHEKVAARVFY